MKKDRDSNETVKTFRSSVLLSIKVDWNLFVTLAGFFMQTR
jgi:hypothetical protein